MSKQYLKLFLQVVVPLLYGGAYWLLNKNELPEPLLSSTLFVIGIYIGEFLLILDERWLNNYYSEPKLEQKNKSQNNTDRENKNSTDLSLPQTQGLITRSLLFVLSLIPLSIYIITSSGSTLGVGVLLGILITLCIELLLLKDNIQLFRERFLRQFNRTPTNNDIIWYIRLFLLFTAVVSVLILL